MFKTKIIVVTFIECLSNILIENKINFKGFLLKYYLNNKANTSNSLTNKNIQLIQNCKKSNSILSL